MLKYKPFVMNNIIKKKKIHKKKKLKPKTNIDLPLFISIRI